MGGLTKPNLGETMFFGFFLELVVIYLTAYTSLQTGLAANESEAIRFGLWVAGTIAWAIVIPALWLHFDNTDQRAVHASTSLPAESSETT